MLLTMSECEFFGYNVTMLGGIRLYFLQWVYLHKYIRSIQLMIFNDLIFLDSASAKRKKPLSSSASKKFKQYCNTDDDELGRLL